MERIFKYPNQAREAYPECWGDLVAANQLVPAPPEAVSTNCGQQVFLYWLSQVCGQGLNGKR